MWHVAINNNYGQITSTTEGSLAKTIEWKGKHMLFYWGALLWTKPRTLHMLSTICLLSSIRSPSIGIYKVPHPLIGSYTLLSPSLFRMAFWPSGMTLCPVWKHCLVTWDGYLACLGWLSRKAISNLWGRMKTKVSVLPGPAATQSQ